MTVVSELRAGLGLRWARAGVTAIVACSLGLIGHVTAGGWLPQGGWLLAGLAVLWASSALLLGRPAGLWRILALVAGGQAAFHLMLTALAGHRSDHTASFGTPQTATSSPGLTQAPTEAAGRRGSFYDLTLADNVDAPAQAWSSPHWITHIVEDLTGPHAAMAMAHLAAAAVIACWLALAEQAVWVLICLLGVTVLAALVAVVSSPTVILTPIPSGKAPLRQTTGPRLTAPPRRSRLQRRGPPAPRLTSLPTPT